MVATGRPVDAGWESMVYLVAGAPIYREEFERLQACVYIFFPSLGLTNFGVLCVCSIERWRANRGSFTFGVSGRCHYLLVELQRMFEHSNIIRLRFSRTNFFYERTFADARWSVFGAHIADPGAKLRPRPRRLALGSHKGVLCTAKKKKAVHNTPLSHAQTTVDSISYVRNFEQLPTQARLR